MNQNRKGNGWVLCASKRIPGKNYYFNVYNGESTWSIDETELNKQIQCPTIHSNYPEPSSKPPDETLFTSTSQDQPRTPVTSKKQCASAIPKSIFPIPPASGLPNYVWAPVPLSYLQQSNTQSFKVQNPGSSTMEHVSHRKISAEDDEIIVQVHCVPKRSVICNENQNFDGNNDLKNPFRTSVQNKIPNKNSNPSCSFTRNNLQFENNAPKAFPSTKTNVRLNNPDINFNLPQNGSNPFRDVFTNKNQFATPNKATHDTPITLTHRFDILNKSNHKFDTPNGNSFVCNSSNAFDTPNEITGRFDKPGLEFLSPNETVYKSNTPPNIVLCSSNTIKKTSYGFEVSEKTIRDFRTLNKTTLGIDTPDKYTSGYYDKSNKTSRLDTSNRTISGHDTSDKYTSGNYDTKNKTISVSDTSKSTTVKIGTPINTISGYDIPDKYSTGYDPSVKYSTGYDVPEKYPTGYEVPEKYPTEYHDSSEKYTTEYHEYHDTSDQYTSGYLDTPKITKETETKVPERFNDDLSEADLRNVLLKRKRKIENLTNMEDAKKTKTSSSETQATPKKRVTFNLDASEIDSSEDFSYDREDMLETSPTPAVEPFSSLRFEPSDKPWYIATDSDVLLNHFDYVDELVQNEAFCQLLVPYSVYRAVSDTSTAGGARPRVARARTVLRKVTGRAARCRVQNDATEIEKLKSQKDQIQCCCLDLMRSKIRVVLITNDNALFEEAKQNGIQVFNLTQIQNGDPKTPDITFDIRKIRFQNTNDNSIPNSKETSKKILFGDQNEQKTDEKYKKSVQNFWQSDNSDISDFNMVCQKTKNLEIHKNEPKMQKSKEETVTSNLYEDKIQNEILEKPLKKVQNAFFGKPITNLIITKNILQNTKAIKEPLSEKLVKTAFENIENHEIDSRKSANENLISEKSTPKESDYYENGINRNFFFKNPAFENHNQNSICKKSVSKEENQNSIFKTLVSKEAVNTGNDNQHSIFKNITPNLVSKESENNDKQNTIFKKITSKNAKSGNENQNSIFEVESNFMPLTSKTVEDYLENISVKSQNVEDFLKNSGFDMICCLRLILENLADVLQESPSKMDNIRACILYNILQRIRKIYGKNRLIEKVIDKLLEFLYSSGCYAKIRRDLSPLEIMQAIGCGMLLVQLLQESIPNTVILTDLQKRLYELLASIENPIEYDCEVPIISREEKNGSYYKNRCNFKKNELDIIEYLKNHYPTWTHFDETTIIDRQNPEIKVFRTLGKNLNRVKLTKMVIENHTKNLASNAEPTFIQFLENDRSKTEDTVVEKERNKISNLNEQNVKKSKTSTFFENFVVHNELKGLKTGEKSEPKLIRTVSNDKSVENTVFDLKKTGFDSKKTDFDSKTTEFDLSQTEHGNTFGVTKSGPKILRNIGLIDRYEDLLKKSDQNKLISKENDLSSDVKRPFLDENSFSAENSTKIGLAESVISLTDTEILSDEDFLLENPKIDSKSENKCKNSRQKNIKILNKTFSFSGDLENLSFSILERNCTVSNKTSNVTKIFKDPNDYTVSDKTSRKMIDGGNDDKSLKAAITLFFKEIQICFQKLNNFIHFCNEIRNTEDIEIILYLENIAKKLHVHIVRIIEKLTLYKDSKGENMNFSYYNLLQKKKIYVFQCRQLSSKCMKHAEILEKMVIELCDLRNKR